MKTLAQVFCPHKDKYSPDGVTNLGVMLCQVVLSGIHQQWQATERRQDLPPAALLLKHGEAT